MSKKPETRYSQFRERQRGEVLKAGDALTVAVEQRGGAEVKVQNTITGKYLTSSGEWKKGGPE